MQLQNYKSIASCRVDLGQLMFLVGPNGSGKSNFLDALRLVADALRTSLDHALRERGTIEAARQVLRERLFTAGELLRQNQLAPDRQRTADDTRQLELFEVGGR